MKTPASWIREYVDLPADVTTEQLAARLTALGLKLESLERPGAAISGPLVVGHYDAQACAHTAARPRHRPRP